LSVATAPGLTGKSLLGKVALLARARARERRGPSRLAAFIADHVGTVAALGLVDAGLWHVDRPAGWIGAGVALLVADLKIRG
jgi:hypothetical protein